MIRQLNLPSLLCRPLGKPVVAEKNKNLVGVNLRNNFLEVKHDHQLLNGDLMGM